jgi:hypothetical protein
LCRRSEQGFARHRLAGPTLVGKYQRQRRLDPLPGHARRQHGQRVSKVDHLALPGSEKSSLAIAFLAVSLMFRRPLF